MSVTFTEYFCTLREARSCFDKSIRPIYRRINFVYDDDTGLSGKLVKCQSRLLHAINILITCFSTSGSTMLMNQQHESVVLYRVKLDFDQKTEFDKYKTYN